MNVSQFFEHWKIAENPFRGEEARHDDVFARMSAPGDQHPEATPAPRGVRSAVAQHSDFEKILGHLVRPSTSIVFGEKGSGKTAIRIQIADRVERHNARSAGDKTFIVPYDDLNAELDQLYLRAGEPEDALKVFRQIRLVDHMDAILARGVDRLIPALFREQADSAPADLGPEPHRRAREMSDELKRDLLLLQAVYDPRDRAGERTARLRRLLRLPPPKDRMLWGGMVAAGWIPAAALWGLLLFLRDEQGQPLFTAVLILASLFTLAYLAVLAKRLAWDAFRFRRLGARLRKQLRFLGRSEEAYAGALAHLDPPFRNDAHLPINATDEQRYAMLGRLRRVLRHFGHTGVLVLIDRVDEPTLVNGDADKMQAIVWPMFNNKFLQQESFGIKMLLPIELRHALFRESSAFFQEARLDKQSLVERLTWSGAMLYDLCDSRLKACLAPDADEIGLLDLFAEDVSRQDLVDALDQMHQPRDAFKFLYRCLNEHCSNVTADQNEWRIPRLVLNNVLRQEADRVQGLYRGIRPA